MPQVKCKVCNKEFYAKPRHLKIGWGKYCSVKCRSKAQLNGKYLKCDYCGKKVYRTPGEIKKSKSKNFFCSRSCHCSWENKFKRNLENAPNWLGGEHTYKKILNRSKIKKICANCGISDERVLVVHHKDRNRKNNKIENLIWLCQNCHCLEHFYK